MNEQAISFELQLCQFTFGSGKVQTIVNNVFTLTLFT